MSGPKGYSYEVVSAEELARRARAAAQQRADTMADRFELAATRAAAWGRSDEVTRLRAGVPHATTTTDDLEARARAFEAARKKLDQGQQQVMRDQARQLVSESLGAVKVSIAGSLGRSSTRQAGSTEVRAPSATPSPDRERQAEQRRLSELGRVIADHPTIAEQCKPALDAVAAAMSHGTPLGVQKALRAAEAKVSDLVHEHSLRQQFEHDRDDALATFADIPGADAVSLRRRLASAQDRAELAATSERLVAAREQVRIDADRAFVLAAAREALAEIGYVVADPEQTVGTSEVAGMVATSPKYPDHALKLLFSSDDARFFTNVVALGDTDPADDAAVEQRSCADVAAVTRLMAEHGVRASMTFHRAPGEVPLERSPGRRTSAGQGQASRARRHREQEQSR